MSSWARPGVKCVCIRFTPTFVGTATPHPDDPKPGKIYTITGGWTDKDGTFIELEECEPEAGYDVTEFRPLITKSQDQDVSLFTHHLESTPVGEDA